MASPPDAGMRQISPEEYLVLERKADYKSEYYAGEIVAMTGASREHNLVSLNLASSLHSQLRGRSCEVYTNDMRVKVTPAGLYLYPDVVVVCGAPEFEDDHVDTLLNPMVVVEVLSESTEKDDRGRKWEHYRRLPALSEYLLVAQDQPRVEQYRRHEGGLWIFSEASGVDSVVELPTIRCTLELSDIYDRVFSRDSSGG